MWSPPRKGGALALAPACCGAPGGRCCRCCRCCCCCCCRPCEPGSEAKGGGEGVAEGTEGDDGDVEAPAGTAPLADAARASPLRISVVSGEVDRARTQGAAWHRGQEGRAVVAAAGGAGAEAEAEAEAFEPVRVGLSASSAAAAASQEEGERGATARRAIDAATAAAAAAAEEKERMLGPRAAAGRAAPLPLPLLPPLLARPDIETRREEGGRAASAFDAKELPARDPWREPAAEDSAAALGASGRGPPPPPARAGKEKDAEVEVDRDAPIVARQAAKPTRSLSPASDAGAHAAAGPPTSKQSALSFATLRARDAVIAGRRRRESMANGCT